jgi:hypothetical protein
MSTSTLTTYLNDHLAGSVVAVKLLDHLISKPAGATGEVFRTLRSEIEEDQNVLRKLLERLAEPESRVRKAAAWLTEKLGQAKLQMDDPGNGELRALEALETLGLGIQGKLALWRALASVAGSVPELGTVDFSLLQRRAIEQFDRVERLRLEAARTALS